MNEFLGIGKKRIGIRYITFILTFLLCFSTACLIGTKISYGDSADEAFWQLSYEVDYDVYVDAPDGGVNLRSGAGTEYEILMDGLIPNDTKLHIDHETKASNGKKWGSTQYGGYSGWIFLGQTSTTKPEESQDVSATTNGSEPAVPDGQTNGYHHPEDESHNGHDDHTYYNGSVNNDPGQADQAVDENTQDDSDDLTDDLAVDKDLNSDDSQERQGMDKGAEPPAYYSMMQLTMLGLLIAAIILAAVFLIKRKQK